jgi:ABC-type multidrug transport system fused ATPase/permease subunit
VTVLALVLLVSTGLALVVPLILAMFIDVAAAGGAMSRLTGAGVAYLVAGVVTQVLDGVSTYLGARIGWDTTNALRVDLAAHLLGLDMGFHTDTTPGEVIERVDGDVTALADFLSRFAVRLLGAAVLLVGVLVVSFAKNAVMGAVLSGYVAAVVTLLYRLRNLAVAASESERETSAAFYGFVEERLAGVEDIRANGAGAFTMQRFAPVMSDWYRRTVDAWRKRVVVWVGANVAFWAGDAIALTLGVWLVVGNRISVGTGYLILQYAQLVRQPIEQVTQQLQELQKAAGGLVRIDHLRSLSSALDESGVTPLPAGPLAVEFDHVTFAYDERVVLDDVTFAIPPGKVVGLLGRTGGGKTTITRLTARLYDPMKGSVRLGGVDLRQADPESLRSRVGVVTQDVQLFEATVRDNLTFFDHSRSDEEILGVLDRGGLGDWVRSVGLRTVVGSGGSGLSAGEQQLIAFCRVFLLDPSVVLLDEPSSRLDPATESMLATASERLFSGRTVIVVAHRLETVRTADLVMVIDAGQVAEFGDRVGLATDPTTRYARLLAAGSGADLA